MRFAALIVAALLATGCASPAMRQADGLVDAFPVGVHRVDAIELHVHESPGAVHEAMRAAHPDNPVITINEALGLRAYAWTSLDGSEIHIPAPTAFGDPVWLCVLGHEIAHAATHHWHPPNEIGVDECMALRSD